MFSSEVPRRLRVRALDLGTGVAVSPMVGVTDLPFRRISREFGANLTFCEMVAGQALRAYQRGRARPSSVRVLATEVGEHPYAIQLFGCDPDALAVGAGIAADLGADLVDLNMGCPARKVVGNGSGSGLLREPDRARACIAAIRRTIPDLPFTVKFRAGWDPSTENAVEIARIIEGEGADGMTLHARFRSQSYGDPPDWRHIARVVEAVSIPVLGNGGIMTWKDAVEMVNQTGCHGVMLARGVFGNPWLIAQVKAAFEGRPVPAPPTPLEKWDVFHRYWRGMVEHRGSRAILDIRKHLIWYSKGMRGSHELRRELHEMTDEAILLERTRAFFERAHADELRHGAAPTAA